MSSTVQEPVRLRRKAVPEDRLDVAILTAATALLVIGLVMNLSASSIPSAVATGSAFTLFGRQFLWAALGFGALVLCARFDYRRLQGWSYAMVPILWLLLLATLLPGVGTEGGGATRWLRFGPLTLQPSEGAKLVMVLFGADVLARKLTKMDDWRHVAVPFLAAVGCTSLFVLMQPDFGTMVVIAATAILLCYLAGAPNRFILALCGGGLLLGFPVMMAEGYRRARLFGFLNSSEDALNTGWQSIQGLVALGSGSLFGLGLGSSRQKYLYLPNAHTDFIFAILGEETGLAGTLTVLFLFAVLAVLGIRAARRATDPFGFLLASGVTGWISLQVLINIGAVTGVLPITGVPLPLLSFGGSSLLFSLAGLGLVAGVARHSAAPADKRRVRPPVFPRRRG